MFICLFNELFDDVSVGAPVGETFIDVTFPNDRFVGAFIIARNRGHFASVINCQRHLFFKMADKNNRSERKRFPYDISNNLSSLDLFYEVCIP